VVWGNVAPRSCEALFQLGTSSQVFSIPVLFFYFLSVGCGLQDPVTRSEVDVGDRLVFKGINREIINVKQRLVSCTAFPTGDCGILVGSEGRIPGEPRVQSGDQCHGTFLGWGLMVSGLRRPEC
jgi:hypothetical protein